MMLPSAGYSTLSAVMTIAPEAIMAAVNGVCFRIVAMVGSSARSSAVEGLSMPMPSTLARGLGSRHSR